MQIVVCKALDFLTDHTHNIFYLTQWFSVILMFLVDKCYSLLCPDTSNLEEYRKKIVSAITEITQKIIYNIQKNYSFSMYYVWNSFLPTFTYFSTLLSDFLPITMWYQPDFIVQKKSTHTMFNSTSCTHSNTYLLFCDAPHTCFSPYRPLLGTSFTKHYTYNKCCPRCANIKLKCSVGN